MNIENELRKLEYQARRAGNAVVTCAQRKAFSKYIPTYFALMNIPDVKLSSLYINNMARQIRTNIAAEVVKRLS